MVPLQIGMLAFFRTLLSLFIVFKMSDVEMGEGGSGQEPSAVTEEGAPAATEAEVGVQQAQVEAASSGGAGGSALTGRGKEGEADREKRKDPKTTFKHLSEVREKGGAEYWTWLEPVLVTELVKGKEEQVCKLKCVRGGGVCGKELSSANPARTAKDHYNAATQRCRGLKQDSGQARLQQPQQLM